MASFIVGITILLTWDFLPGSEVVHEVFPAMLLSTLAYAVTSFMTPDSASDTVLNLMNEASHRPAD